MEQEQTTPNPKCPRCKCYWKPDETDIKSSGLCCKTCKKCRTYKRPINLKAYYNNRENNLLRNKEYREKNKEMIKEKKEEIVKCECGCEVQKDKVARHLKTKKHQNNLKKIAERKEQEIKEKEEQQLKEEKFKLYDAKVENARKEEKAKLEDKIQKEKAKLEDKVQKEKAKLEKIIKQEKIQQEKRNQVDEEKLKNIEPLF